MKGRVQWTTSKSKSLTAWGPNNLSLQCPYFSHYSRILNNDLITVKFASVCASTLARVSIVCLFVCQFSFLIKDFIILDKNLGYIGNVYGYIAMGPFSLNKLMKIDYAFTRNSIDVLSRIKSNKPKQEDYPINYEITGNSLIL